MEGMKVECTLLDVDILRDIQRIDGIGKWEKWRDDGLKKKSNDAKIDNDIIKIIKLAEIFIEKK